MVQAAAHPVTRIKLRGRRKRALAGALRDMQVTKLAVMSAPGAIRVVCISDTHNRHPEIPPGDVLIHAGDLTENGSFDEVQAELNWLSDQPHKYKILIAGNHDVLLDDVFLSKYPERRYGQTKSRMDLDWGSVIYLQDACVTLEFPPRGVASDDQVPRKLTVFGSPWTPQYGRSAFQYRPDDENHWASKFSTLDRRPDIIVTHGPPKHHLDARDFYRAGCPFLAEEIARVRPRLVVFGHIHVSYGREDVVMDQMQRAYEEVMTGWAGWAIVGFMAALVVWARLTWIFQRLGVREEEKTTTFVNAAIVGGPKNELKNDPIVVEL